MDIFKANFQFNITVVACRESVNILCVCMDLFSIQL